MNIVQLGSMIQWVDERKKRKKKIYVTLGCMESLIWYSQ